ncbi:nucleotidyl transferase AbiEii/AbiGii toxin family protein, partial [Patescibacteria group bacterium]|nr:nucleotidyl transferase AbiEii/AbiGii toxin family protein [Patescibacteria group bacterium]
MLSLKQIESFYPEKERSFPRNMYREYLQYKVLEIIFSSAESAKLSFLGGACLRIAHESGRFSEDLDFDNFGLTEKDFENISVLVKGKLEYEGYNVETRNVSKGAYRCYLKIPGILFSEGLSSHIDEKILIQPDSASHGFEYKPDIYLLNKFDVTARINVTPPDILLSQKISAVFGRKTPKGRD